jgi:3-oxoacyl-[acyl-carrier protein] reductase
VNLGIAGRVVWITGASGGIGGALARAFAEEGARLVLHAHRRGDALRALVQAAGWEAVVVEGDLVDPATAEACVAAGRARFGRVDDVVANAGWYPGADQPIARADPARLRREIEVNLLGPILTLRSFAAGLASDGPRGDGRGATATLIGSTAGRFGEAGHVGYASAKAGLVGLLHSFKNEIVQLDPYGRVNLVQPGWTVTEMARASLEVPGAVQGILRTMPLRQLARPDDVARVVVGLASPRMSRHVSGETITVAGGMEGRGLWPDDRGDTAGVVARLDKD